MHGIVFSGLQLVRIIEGPDKRGPDNRGCTVVILKLVWGHQSYMCTHVGCQWSPASVIQTPQVVYRMHERSVFENMFPAHTTNQ